MRSSFSSCDPVILPQALRGCRRVLRQPDSRRRDRSRWGWFRFHLKDLCKARARNEEYVDLETYEVSGASAKLIG